MEISWAVIGKIIISTSGVYILLPILLIIRDILLWKAICRLLLTRRLKDKIKRYSLMVYEWNTQHTVKSIVNGDGYFIDGRNVTKEKFMEHDKRGDYLRSEINELDLYINSKSQIVGQLLKHYKHDAKNPINNLIDAEYKQIECLKK